MSRESEHVSSLPVWLVTRLGPQKIGIQCPRKDCKGKAVVSRKWLRRTNIIGRVCTYCFKTSQVPKEMVKDA